MFDCDLDPSIVTSGSQANLLPASGTTLTATAGQSFSIDFTSFVPATVTMPVSLGGTSFMLSINVDSVKNTSEQLSGSASNFLSIQPTSANGMAAGNSIGCFSIVGTIPASPTDATYNLIVTPLMWGNSIAGNLAEFPSPQTSTYYIKVGAGSDPLTSTDNTKWRTISYNGQARVFNVYVPSIYNGNDSVPLLFNIHGWTGSSTKQQDFANFEPIADTANFIVVHPQALGDIPSWDLTGTSDIDFLMFLLDTLQAEYNIDSNRIYSTGFSQGGVMSCLLACSKSDRIAAVAPVAGTMTSETRGACRPIHYMPIMQTHGTSDNLASYSGGGGYLGAQETIDYFVNINGCNKTPIKTDLPDINNTDASTVESYLYTGAPHAVSVEHYKVLSGGHEWPALTAVKNDYGTGNRNRDFNLSTEIWRFLSKYRLSELGELIISGLNQELGTENMVWLYPNPNDGIFTLSVNNNDASSVVFTDILGKIVFESTLNTHSTTIDLSHLPQGVYMYRVQNLSGGLTNGKIIVQ